MKDWVRLYTSAWSNKKFLALSLEAHGLWAIGLAYSGGSEREGFIPTELAERVTRYGCDQSVTDVTTPEMLAEQLVSSGLWEPVEGGWMMHNYDGRQAKDEANREANRIRQQRFRATHTTTDNGRNAPVTHESVTSRPREEEKREEKKDTPKPPSGDVAAVWQKWVASTGRASCKLDEKRKRLIAARLKDYPLDDVVAAVQGWERDPWEGRRQQNEIAILLRDNAHLEKFRDLWRQPAVLAAAVGGHVEYEGPSELARKFW